MVGRGNSVPERFVVDDTTRTRLGPIGLEDLSGEPVAARVPDVWNSFRRGSAGGVRPVGHRMTKDDTWFSTNATCPVCETLSPQIRGVGR